MKALCVVALVPFCCGAVETDNVEHASVSAAIGAIFTVAFQKTDHPMLYAAGATLAIGLAKECYDARSGGSGFSKQDLAADAVGTVIGVGATGLIVGPLVIGWKVKF